MNPVNTHYFIWAKALSCCSTGFARVYLGCHASGCHFPPPQLQALSGMSLGPHLPAGFLSGVSDLLHNHSGTHLHRPSASQAGCVALGAACFRTGKSQPEIEEPFPMAPCSSIRHCQSLRVGSIPAEIQALFNPSALSLCAQPISDGSVRDWCAWEQN